METCTACFATTGQHYVTCTVCHLHKPPVGRSVAAEAANGMCNFECEGYFSPPCPGRLWPGETKDQS